MVSGRNTLHPIANGRNVINGSLWNGQIDEVQFYDHALTHEEVESLMPQPGP